MVPGNTTDRTRDKRQRQYGDTGQHGPVDDPLVPYRVAIGTDKEQGNDEMGKGQPVEAVKKKGVGALRIANALPDLHQPVMTRPLVRFIAGQHPM